MLRPFLVSLAILSILGLMTGHATEGVIRMLVPFALMGLLLRLRGGNRWVKHGPHPSGTAR